MGGNDSKAVALNIEFGERLSEELKSLRQAFGSMAPGLRSRAVKAALEHMVKTYPEAIFAVTEGQLWDDFTIREKIMWYLCIGILAKHRRESSAANVWAAYEREGKNPPLWAVPDPKNEDVIVLRIGLRK